MKITFDHHVDEHTVALIPTITLFWIHCSDPDCDYVHGISVNLVVFNLIFSLVFLNHE